ncbi:MAG: N-acetylneuraminate synthase [Bacteroidota bacterium]|nr:N-acetylneuraminate synthase [Bacteroidota bacterium]
MPNKSVFIIAEAGVNHNGNLETAKKLIDAAKLAGADAVKFQTFQAKATIAKKAEKADYQKSTTSEAETQYEMIQRLQLSEEDHQTLMNYSNRKQIQFLSSPFDLNSIHLLDKLGLDTFKIPSGEIVSLPYLEWIGKLNKKVIMSTGMADLGEIEDALNVLIQAGTDKRNITILHVNTEYPTPMEDVNLKAMQTIRDAFQVDVGYSDHTLGIEVPIAAVALGATVIEKHFTLDKKANGPDHRASLEPNELKQMVLAIRNIDKALGDGIKKPSKSEKRNKPIVRKSIVAQQKIAKGEKFTSENLGIKRPGTGISPMRWHEVLGKAAKRNFNEDELIEL